MTIGWILEGDRDRFLATLDPTPPPLPRAPEFRCPFCKDNFSDRTKFNEHVQQFHVLSRPFILIDGIEPGAEDSIRFGSAAPTIEILNCTELAAAFDGEPIGPVDVAYLVGRLAKVTRATVRLRLINRGDGLIQPADQEYRLKVIAPDEASLASVDKLFLSTLGIENVDLEQVAVFYETTHDGVAAEYAEALGDYVRAVLLKDGDLRTGVSRRLHHFHEIQSRALNVLQSFNRPLAQLLCALLRFNLNDFSRWRETSGFDYLDHTYSLLGPLAQEGVTEDRNHTSKFERQGTRVFRCPVDFGTDAVTRLAVHARQLSRWGSSAEQQFRTLADQPTLDSFDRAKIRALWAVTALRLGVLSSARVALQLLDADPTFGVWASRKLGET